MNALQQYMTMASEYAAITGHSYTSSSEVYHHTDKSVIRTLEWVNNSQKRLMETYSISGRALELRRQLDGLIASA